MKVVGYTRVSTDGQVGEDRFGLPVQKEKIETYCRENDMEIVQWFTDEGESGAKERPGFDEICYGSLPEGVEAVVVAKSDRVARDINVYFYYKMLLTKRDVKLISVAEDFGVYGAFAPILEAFSMCVAQMERNNITMRTSAGRNAKAKRGGFPGGTVPYGYELVKGKLTVNESEKQIVRYIFECRSEGFSYDSIAKELNSQKTRTKNGVEWSSMTVRGLILRRKFYEGYYKYKGAGGDWVVGEQDAILREDEFIIPDNLDCRWRGGVKAEN